MKGRRPPKPSKKRETCCLCCGNPREQCRASARRKYQRGYHQAPQEKRLTAYIKQPSRGHRKATTHEDCNRVRASGAGKLTREQQREDDEMKRNAVGFFRWGEREITSWTARPQHRKYSHLFSLAAWYTHQAVMKRNRRQRGGRGGTRCLREHTLKCNINMLLISLMDDTQPYRAEVRDRCVHS